MNKKLLDLIVFISAAMIAVGVFLPLTKLPIYGEVTYYRASPYESYIVIAFALLAPALIILEKPKLLMAAPLGVWITLFFPTIKETLTPHKSGFINDVSHKISSVVQDTLFDMFSNLLHLSWGAYIFIAGLLLFTLSSAIRTFK